MPDAALILRDVTKRISRERRGRLASTRYRLARLAGFDPGPEPNTGPAVIDGVNVTLSAGEIAILIGAPGSGKTALLEIVAGLMRPTAGLLRVAGGTASLIHPKLGWHLALSGRDNLVLRALTEGLSVSEAKVRCERIAAFAKIDGWLDRPVGDYPDVLRSRLAFGVMAFLEARVLLWDDLLERHDPLFRQQCLALIPALLRGGKTILMATHDMGKAEEISSRAVWMERGRVRMDGPTAEVLDRYLEPGVTSEPLDPPREFAGPARLAAVALLGADGTPATCYQPGEPITVSVELELTHRVESPYFLVGIAGAFGPIAAASMFHDGCRPPSIEGRYRIDCTFTGLVLAPRQRFTIRFAVYAEDATTIVYPKQVIASFTTGGSAASCGFSHALASGRILGGPPVLADYEWRMPDGSRAAWTSSGVARHAKEPMGARAQPSQAERERVTGRDLRRADHHSA